MTFIRMRVKKRQSPSSDRKAGNLAHLYPQRSVELPTSSEESRSGRARRPSVPGAHTSLIWSTMMRRMRVRSILAMMTIQTTRSITGSTSQEERAHVRRFSGSNGSSHLLLSFCWGDILRDEVHRSLYVTGASCTASLWGWASPGTRHLGRGCILTDSRSKTESKIPTPHYF